MVINISNCIYLFIYLTSLDFGKMTYGLLLMDGSWQNYEEVTWDRRDMVAVRCALTWLFFILPIQSIL
jgi:dolichyl-phosphate-mannose--protein O-mannosyl transferase